MNADVPWRAVHPLVAGPAFQRGYRASLTVTVCGEMLTSAPMALPPATALAVSVRRSSAAGVRVVMPGER
ncbi:MAG TPA: hypothetical protein VFO16_09495 [Pseudonocardiaceae bacterium]|nr:hypothetical protein [Pseudonocardiaceae bacterium]